MNVEKNAFEYMIVGKNIICRFSLGADGQSFNVIGEVYDYKTKTWVRKSSTMRYKMSGEGRIISANEVKKIVHLV